MSKPFKHAGPTKVCTHCHTRKPFSEFYKITKAPHRRESWCNSCKHNSLAKYSARRADPAADFTKLKACTDARRALEDRRLARELEDEL